MTDIVEKLILALGAYFLGAVYLGGIIAAGIAIQNRTAVAAALVSAGIGYLVQIMPVLGMPRGVVYIGWLASIVVAVYAGVDLWFGR